MKHLLALAFILTSCGSAPKEDVEDPDKAIPPEQKIIGRIASVSKAGKFVLIQKYGPGPLPTNPIYQSRGPDGRSASLRPSGERVRDFFAADLVSGTVEKGDAVITYLPTPKAPDDSPLEDENDPASRDPALPKEEPEND